MNVHYYTCLRELTMNFGKFVFRLVTELSQYSSTIPGNVSKESLKPKVKEEL